MPTRKFPKILLAAAIAFAAPFAHAEEPLLKPVPMPDLSKLAPAKADDMRKAREEFDKVRATLAGDPLAETYALLATVYARNGLYGAASVAIEDSVLLAPKDGRWRYLQGIVMLGDKNPLGARAAFEHAFALDQSYLPIRTAAANQRIEKGDLDGARKMLEEYTAQKKEQAVPFSMLGDIALKQKRYKDAIREYEAALKIEPGATKLYASLAEARAGAGDAKAAADARARAGDVAPMLYDPLGAGLFGRDAPKAGAPRPNADPKTQAVGEAIMQTGQRQYAAARASLDKALKLAPNDAEVLALYARVEAMSGNVPAAQSRATAAVAANGKSAVVHLSQGVVREVAGDEAGAQRSYEEAVRIDPKFYGARISLGNVLLRNNKAVDAVTQYRAAAELPGSDGESWARLVAAEVAAGRCAAGLKDVNGALAKNSKDPYLMQLFVRLASTCPAASPEEKRMALDYAGNLYKSTEAPQVGEAYALALAANGKWDDAVKTQQGAMFVVLRSEGKEALASYRDVMQQLQARKLPDRPWPAGAQIYRPARLQADLAPPPAAQAKPANPAPPKR